MKKDLMKVLALYAVVILIVSYSIYKGETNSSRLVKYSNGDIERCVLLEKGTK